ncbi:hypothetical protein CG473_00210 [Mycoplasma testudineum]|nr:hypothetical protein CG473_00210 [Mycoplasma testudineum]
MNFCDNLQLKIALKNMKIKFEFTFFDYNMHGRESKHTKKTFLIKEYLSIKFFYCNGKFFNHILRLF